VKLPVLEFESLILDYKTEAKKIIDAKHTINLGEQSQSKEIPSGFALAEVRDVVLVGSSKQIEKIVFM